MTTESNTPSEAAEVAGVQEAVRSTGSYTADNDHSNSVAADGHSRACVHERGSGGAWHWCRKCGIDMSPGIPEFTGTYGDGPNCARSCP